MIDVQYLLYAVLHSYTDLFECVIPILWLPTFPYGLFVNTPRHPKSEAWQCFHMEQKEFVGSFILDQATLQWGQEMGIVVLHDIALLLWWSKISPSLLLQVSNTHFVKVFLFALRNFRPKSFHVKDLLYALFKRRQGVKGAFYIWASIRKHCWN